MSKRFTTLEMTMQDDMSVDTHAVAATAHLHYI